MSVDDPCPVQVVWRELDADPVAGEDPDPEAAHLSGHVSEDDPIHVVELDAEHRVRERFDHLSLEFDLFLLGHRRNTLPAGGQAGAAEPQPPAPAPPVSGAGPVLVTVVGVPGAAVEVVGEVVVGVVEVIVGGAALAEEWAPR